jgi:hypothetical protein
MGADTYENAIEADADREQQKRLLAALNGWDRALRRDDCSVWCINGKHGCIHTWGDGETWLLYVECRSALAWTWVKRRLGFCTVTVDGDEAGCLRLSRPRSSGACWAFDRRLPMRRTRWIGSGRAC